MTPSKRSFTTRGIVDHRSRAADARRQPALHLARRDRPPTARIAVRIYHKPLVLLIWFGPLLMAFGGLLSLSDRRLRVGAPKPAKPPRALQAAE